MNKNLWIQKKEGLKTSFQISIEQNSKLIFFINKLSEVKAETK